MQRLLFLIAILCIFPCLVYTQPSVNSVTWEPRFKISFNNPSNWVQVRLDSTPQFNSGLYREVIIKNYPYLDSIEFLQLNTKYYLSYRYIDINGTPTSSIVQMTNTIGEMPFSEFMNKPSNPTINSKFYKTLNYSYDEIEYFCFYDTTPLFNSIKFQDLSSYNGKNQNINFMQHNHTYYIKTKVKWRNFETNWIIKKVINDFGSQNILNYFTCPNIVQLIGSAPLQYSKKFKYFFINNTNSNDTFSIYSGMSTWPKLIVNDTATKNYKVFVTYTDFYDRTYSFISNYKLTNIFFGDLLTNKFNPEKNGINIGYLSCNTAVDIEVFDFSNLATPKFSKSVNILKGAITAKQTIDYNPYLGDVLRVRINVNGFYSEWRYWYPQNYNPFKYVSSTAYLTISNNSPTSGALVEIMQDTSNNFNSKNFRKFYVRDSNTIKVPLYFRTANYIKVRYYSKSLNFVEYKLFSTFINLKTPSALGGCYAYVFQYPSIEVISANKPIIDLDVEYRLNKKGVKNYIIFNYNSRKILDKYNVSIGDSVEYQYRFINTLDSTYWSPKVKCKLEFNNTSSVTCFPPFITYNGYLNNKDTFTIGWENRQFPQPDYFLLLYTDAKNNILAMEQIDKQKNKHLIRRNIFGSAKFFILTAKCANLPSMNLQNSTPFPIYNNIVVYSKQGNLIITDKSIQLKNTPNYTVEIFNIQGKLLKKAIVNDIFYFDFLAAGSYFVRCRLSNLIIAQAQIVVL